MRKSLPGIISLCSLLILVVIQVYIIRSYYNVKSRYFDVIYSKAILNTIEIKDYSFTDSLDIALNEFASQQLLFNQRFSNPSVQHKVLISVNSLLKKFDNNLPRIKKYLAKNKLDTFFQSHYFIKEIAFLNYNNKIKVYKNAENPGSIQKAKGIYIKSYYKEGDYYAVEYEFYIDFTHKQRVIFAEIKGLLVIVVLTIAVVIVTFIYTLLTLHRQKKVTELKDDFIDNITHEFKTPLSIISVAVSSLKEHRIRNDERKFAETCDILEKQNRFLSKMIENAIDVSLLDRGKTDDNKKPVVLKKFISEIIVSFINTEVTGKKVQITEDYKIPDDFEYVLDAVQFTRVIVNLLNNSVKYCESNPFITLHVSTDNQLKIEIEDNGIGIKEEHLDKVFNKFYRANKPASVKGLGLGLYIVKRIIENLNGSIQLKSSPGKGTTVTITLPM